MSFSRSSVKMKTCRNLKVTESLTTPCIRLIISVKSSISYGVSTSVASVVSHRYGRAYSISHSTLTTSSIPKILFFQLANFFLPVFSSIISYSLSNAFCFSYWAHSVSWLILLDNLLRSLFRLAVLIGYCSFPLMLRWYLSFCAWYCWRAFLMSTVFGTATCILLTFRNSRMLSDKDALLLTLWLF